MKYKLGQKVKYNAYMWRNKGGLELRWPRRQLREPREGIVVGKRTVYEGHTDGGYGADDPMVFVPKNHLSVYLVASDLRRFVHVMASDMEPAEEITVWQDELEVMNSRLKHGSLSLPLRYNDSGARRMAD